MEPKFRFSFMPAPDDLALYINTLFSFETDERRFDDILPAYSAQLIAFGRGEARMRLAQEEVACSSAAFFLSPMQSAAAFAMEGPVRACGVSLTAHGWAALAGLPVDRYGHRKIEASDILGTGPAANVAEAGLGFAEGRLQPSEACEILAGVVRQALRRVKSSHTAFITATLDWLGSSLSPDIAGLVASTGLSPRQIQRLAKRFFGKPPTGLVRRYRAIRAATVLSQPGLHKDHLLEVESAFFDQAHMIRDIRLFTGRTPTALEAEKSLTSDTLGPEGYGLVDLFGSDSAD